MDANDDDAYAEETRKEKMVVFGAENNQLYYDRVQGRCKKDPCPK